MIELQSQSPISKPLPTNEVERSSSIISNFINKIKTDQSNGDKTALNEINEVVKQEKKEKLKKNEEKTTTTTTNKPKITVVEKDNNDEKGSLGFLNIILDALDKKLNEDSNVNVEKTTEKVNTSLLLKLFSGKLEEEKPKIKINKNENFQDDLEEALRESRNLGKRLKDLLDDIDYE